MVKGQEDNLKLKQSPITNQSVMNHQLPIQFGDTEFVNEIRDLLAFQFDSYNKLIENVIPEILEEIFPIEDTEGKSSLELLDYKLNEPVNTPDECLDQGKTYAYSVELSLRLNKNGKQTVSNVVLMDLPMMTEKGSFIFNGEERIIVSQLHRTPGVHFSKNTARIIPYRGSWVEFEIKSGRVYARLDRRKSIPATCFLRFLGWESNSEILVLFDNNEVIANTLSVDDSADRTTALIKLGEALRIEEPEVVEKTLELMLFDRTRYNLTSAGRYVMNRKLDMNVSEDKSTLEPEDIVSVIKKLLENPVPDEPNDLKNLRIQSTGELLGNQLNIGMHKMARMIKERLSLNDLDKLTPAILMKKNGSNPLDSIIEDFFKNSQLSQTLQSINPLDELTHKRRVFSSSRNVENEFDDEDLKRRLLHPSHFGCFDPFETPEGPNVGIINTLTNFAEIDEYGFLSRKAGHAVRNTQQTLGVSANLIPLIEHNDPNRTLMGCNMSRQAVPLLFSEPPIVQTRMREKSQKTQEFL